MPHLSDLQRQHKAVIFACLSAEPEQTIRTFVAKNDKNMGFRVGVDGQGRMWKSWMEAAGLEGIPTAFIVDAVGKIAWIGNPAEMDEPLRQIAGGQVRPPIRHHQLCASGRPERRPTASKMSGSTGAIGSPNRWRS